MTFNSLTPSIVFQEVPNEISLCFSITGCKMGCKGCHSTELWQANNGSPLSNQVFEKWLTKYQGLITCVIFFGGEWQPSALIEKLKTAKKLHLKTCLYSGQQYVDIHISQYLNYLKTGAWREELGGLDSPTSNQIFRNMQTGEKLNYLFYKNNKNTTEITQGDHHVAA